MRATERKLAGELGEAAIHDSQLDFPRVSTLHTYAKRLVHRYGRAIDIEPLFSIPIDSRGERLLVISDVMRDLRLDLSLDEVSSALAKVRATYEWPASFSAPEGDKDLILEKFNLLLQVYRTLDMEGVVLAACRILRTPNARLPQLFLQVDEYQDLNPVDQEFISLLSSHPASEIVVVGDDAQSIYSFRHANLAGVRSLWDSDDWEGLCFPDSFRLQSHILNAALDLLGDAGYLGTTINRKPPNGKNIPVLQCTSANIQIEAIAKDIEYRLQLAHQDPDVDLSLRDFLVLCPTGTQVEQVVRTLNRDFGLPSHSPSKPSVPDDFWGLILVLRMASSSDPLALRQWLPLIGYTQEEIADLRLCSVDQGVRFFEFVSSQRDGRLEILLRSLEAVEAGPQTANRLLEVLESLDPLTIPADFPELLRSWASDDGILPSLATMVQLLYRYLGILEGEEVVTAEDDRILVATMHSAKGLEAAYVYCAWMSSTFMPLPERDPDEQRRIMYVALTRAKRDVILTFPERYNPAANRRLGREELSPFIEEIFGHVRLLRVTAPSIRGDQLPWYA